MGAHHYRNYAPSHPVRPPLPMANRADEIVPGHWLLARLGKRVLRPGGTRLTRRLLTAARVAHADVVELGPGLGQTAAAILVRWPHSYHGVEHDADAAQTAGLVAGQGNVKVANASATGLPDSSADVVIGEAVLTLQDDSSKAPIVSEVVRLLRPGGRYAIHELALTPDAVPAATRADIRRSLARVTQMNVCPLTITEWQRLLTRHALVIEKVQTARVALLSPQRVIADEGLVGALRFAVNLLVRRDARRRVLEMRRTFRHHRHHFSAVALIARKPAATDLPPRRDVAH